MTKQELITTLVTKYFWIEQTEANWIKNPLSTYTGYELFRVPVLEKDGEAVWDSDIMVWKDALGNYYWKSGEPKGRAYSFQKEVEDYIKLKIQDGTIKSGFISKMDFVNEKAIVTISIDQSGQLYSKNVLIDKGLTGNFQYKVVN